MSARIFNSVVCPIVGIFFLTAAVEARPPKHPLKENDAVDLLLHTLTHDNVYSKRISLACVTFDTVETTRIYFEIAVREKHNAKCGGDPDTNPVIDRYRVNRASGKIEWLNAVEDNWQPYDPAKIR